MSAAKAVSKASSTNNWGLVKSILESSGLRTAYFWGPPGIGKTYGAQRWGLKGRNVYTVTLTEETPSAELRGHFIPRDGSFVWHDGPAARAMREGARLILNEAAHASCDLLSFLYGVMESPETSKITLPTGEILKPKDGFQCIITDNVAPTSLPEALRDRVDVVVHLATPSNEALNTFPDSIRSIIESCAIVSDPERRISLRSWECIDRLHNGGLDYEFAAAAVLGPKWEGVKDSLRLHLASKSK